MFELLIGLLIVIVIVGVILWWVNTYIPLTPPFKMFANGVGVLIVIWYLIHVLLTIHPMRLP